MRTEAAFSLPYAHPAVRDLAFMLLSPPPWDSGREIPRQLLLGPDGPERLTALDTDPAPLIAWLEARPTRRLGHYAEALLAFWFQQSPHIELVACNLAVRSRSGHTLGEFDFLVRIAGQPWHIETASKFYLQLGHGPDTLLGPSLQDAWRLKAAKLSTQLALSRRPEARAALPPGFDACRAATRLTGWLFYAHPELHPESALCGWYAPLHGPWPQHPDTRWAWLPRLSWLAPARRLEADTSDADSLRAQLGNADAPQLVAELARRENGYWEEVARGFVVPPGWPPEHRLTALMGAIEEK